MATTTIDKLAAGEKPQSEVAKFSGFLDKLKPQLALALPRHLNADRMARLALTAFSTNPELRKCKADTIAGAIMTAAQLGLEPGVNGQCYLIPYKGVCTFVPGWKGLVDLVARSGRASVWTGAVFEGDAFDYQLGADPYCRHTPSAEADDSASPFTFVYAIGRVRGAEQPIIEVWSRAKVLRHLGQFNRVGDRHYAKASENNLQMYGRKVALLQVLKYMPSSIELSVAQQAAEQAVSGEGMVIDGATQWMPDADGVPPGEASATPEGDRGPSGKPDADGVIGERLTYAQLVDRVDKAQDAEAAALVLDEARDHLPADQQGELALHWKRKWGQA